MIKQYLNLASFPNFLDFKSTEKEKLFIQSIFYRLGCVQDLIATVINSNFICHFSIWKGIWIILSYLLDLHNGQTWLPQLYLSISRYNFQMLKSAWKIQKCNVFKFHSSDHKNHQEGNLLYILSDRQRQLRIHIKRLLSSMNKVLWTREWMKSVDEMSLEKLTKIETSRLWSEISVYSRLKRQKNILNMV